MAKVTYQVVQKPIEERIIDAACIYWGVERSYFQQSRDEGNRPGRCADTTVTYRKGVIYYLIKQETTYSFDFMAKKFGFLSHQPVLRLVQNVDATKNIYKQHFNDINQILHLANKLDADMITTEVKLVNNKLEITTG